MRTLSYAQLFGLLVAALLALLAASALQAWTGPTSTPPNGNVAAPINVGTTDQVKNAGLSVNSFAVFGSQYVQNKLGINTPSPVVSLDVNGTVRLGNGGEVCQAITAGSLRYNASSGTIDYCNGSAWQALSTTAAAAPFTPQVQTFASSGTWTKPSGATNVKVECWGGGGGGSGVSTAGQWDQSGSGGGGGGYVTNTYLASSLPASVAVTVGAGGAGGSGGSSSSGGTGGTSSFGSYVSAYGGTGAYTNWADAGTNPSYGGAGGGGSGGSVSGGGAGGSAGTASPSSRTATAGGASSCGGGGGGAGYWDYGYSASGGGSSGCGGNGGDGSGSSTGSGNAGVAPGGGGGGGGGHYGNGTGGAGGAGGRGQCTITST